MSIAEELLESLEKCNSLSSEDDIHFESYVQTWQHLRKILEVMGSVFKYVAADVIDKGIRTWEPNVSEVRESEYIRDNIYSTGYKVKVDCKKN